MFTPLPLSIPEDQLRMYQEIEHAKNARRLMDEALRTRDVVAEALVTRAAVDAARTLVDAALIAERAVRAARGAAFSL